MLQLLQLAQDYSSYDNSFVGGGFSTSGSILLMVIIAVAGYIVQARLQSVFHKYSQVAFPGKAVSPLRVEDTSAGLLLTADARVQVRVYTLYGVLVKALPMQAGETVQIDLAPGVYIVNQQKVVVYGK